MKQIKLKIWDAAFKYVERMLEDDVIHAVPPEKLAVAFGILIDKLILLEERGTGAGNGDIYERWVRRVFGAMLEDNKLITREPMS
jgi:hypothetical protein